MKPELDAARSALEAAAKATTAALDLLSTMEATKPAVTIHELPRFVTRRQAKALLSLEVRAFDRAGKELGFLKPGRDLLLPSGDLVAWIERQAVARAALAPVDIDDPIPFERFRSAVQRRAG